MGKLILNGKEYVNSRIDGYPPLIYFTDEREIGVWTNGKPLYEKTYITHSTSVNTDIIFDVSSLSIDTVVYIGGIFDRFVNNKHYWQEWNMAEGANNYAMARIDSDDGHGTNGTLRGYIKYEGTTEQHFTIRYTKTTDTAGSGRWSNAGDQTHHYSTSEQVVGTWIDGKPIYEKTIVWNDTTAKAYVRKDIHDLNIDTLVSITGFFNRLESNNKVYWYPFNSMEASSEYGFYRIDNENGYANGQILWRINYNNTNTQRFIFTYTKTTD